MINFAEKCVMPLQHRLAYQDKFKRNALLQATILHSCNRISSTDSTAKEAQTEQVVTHVSNKHAGF
jgi:hypothetical protein